MRQQHGKADAGEKGLGHRGAAPGIVIDLADVGESCGEGDYPVPSVVGNGYIVLIRASELPLTPEIEDKVSP
jgi:hypothetical protein